MTYETGESVSKLSDEYVTIVLVGKMSMDEADEFVSHISQDNKLAIMDVRPTTDHELRGFNPTYLAHMTE